MTPLPAAYYFLSVFIMCVMPTKSQYTLPEFKATEAPEMPKGIFSYHRSESQIQNEMHVPNADLSQPMEIATELINAAVAKASHKNEGVSGVQIPLPFGLSPLNLQLSQNSDTELGVSHDEESSTVIPSTIRRAPDLNSQTRTALESARRICIQQTQALCDMALEKYHRLKFGRSSADDRRLLRKAQPKNFSSYVQTGLAKWLVPGLDQQLNQFVLDRTSSTTLSSVGTSSRDERRRPRPKSRRIKTVLPLRRTLLPPRS